MATPGDQCDSEPVDDLLQRYPVAPPSIDQSPSELTISVGAGSR